MGSLQNLQRVRIAAAFPITGPSAIDPVFPLAQEDNCFTRFTMTPHPELVEQLAAAGDSLVRAVVQLRPPSSPPLNRPALPVTSSH